MGYTIFWKGRDPPDVTVPQDKAGLHQEAARRTSRISSIMRLAILSAVVSE